MAIKIIRTILITIILQSCNSQNIDLANLKLPDSKEKIIGTDTDFKKDQYVYALGLGERYKDFVVYKFTEQSLLNYNNKSLIGKLSNIKRYQNKVEFITDDKQNKIFGYELSIYTEKESKLLFEEVKVKLGKPNYDDNNASERNMIWEDKDCIYYLQMNKNVIYNDMKTVCATLKVVSVSLEELVPYLTNPTYYEVYIKERNKKGKNILTYSYSVFANEELKSGNDYYIKGIQGIR